VLEAVRKINAGLVDAEAEVLTEDEKALLEKAELTEEQLAELNEAILDAIENNAMPLYMSAAFEEFLETNADEDEIQLVVNELWNDNNLKYCAATAMVVAHHNGELPSIPAETSASALVIGACQGVDVTNVEAKVSTGEIAADVAFEILKVIAAVALTICVGVVLLEALMTLVEVGFLVGAAVLGGGFLGVLLGAVLSIAFGGEIVKMAEFWGTKGLDFLGNIADVAYEALKKGAKKLYQFTVERIVPAVKPTLEKAIGFLRETAAKVFSFLRSKTVITAKA